MSSGTRLGPYEIIAALGGGMGEVYKARDTRLERIVAVKVLLPALAADPLFRERRTPTALLSSAFNEGWGTFAPDGKWMPYVSDENQQPRVYVRSFPDGEVKTQISTAAAASHNGGATAGSSSTSRRTIR